MTSEIGNRRDAQRTKAAILLVAQQAFSQFGYASAGMREIAAGAGVTTPMLLRYFGSKAGLFEAALTAAMPRPAMLERPRSDFGRIVREALLREGEIVRPSRIVALSASDPVAAAISARVLRDRGIAPLAAWLGEPDGRARATQIAMLTSSFDMYIRQLPNVSADAAETQAIADWLESTVQEIVDRVV